MVEPMVVSRRRHWTARLIVGILFALSAACGPGVGNEGDLVGGPCTTDADCAEESRCMTGGDFPGGTCATRCSSHDDCPEGTRCVSEEGGACLLQCEVPDDCRAGYSCRGQENESGGGDSLVCIDD